MLSLAGSLARQTRYNRTHCPDIDAARRAEKALTMAGRDTINLSSGHCLPGSPISAELLVTETFH